MKLSWVKKTERTKRNWGGRAQLTNCVSCANDCTIFLFNSLIFTKNLKNGFICKIRGRGKGIWIQLQKKSVFFSKQLFSFAAEMWIQNGLLSINFSNNKSLFLILFLITIIRKLIGRKFWSTPLVYEIKFLPQRKTFFYETNFFAFLCFNLSEFSLLRYSLK
jgi:hypothetical protein